MTDNKIKPRFRCRLCDYETTEPRYLPQYAEPLRCFDLCCEGPVTWVIELPKTESTKEEIKP